MGVGRRRWTSAAWAFGLSWIVVVDPVAGWCGSGAVLAGVIGGLVGGGRGALLAAAGAAPLIHAAWLIGDPVGLVFLGAAFASGADRARAAMALVVTLVAGAEASRQVLLDALLPGASSAAWGLVGLGLAAVLALGAPPDARSGGLGVALVGAIAAARGQWFVWTLAGVPAVDTAAEVAARRAVGAWPLVEEQALRELALGEEAGVLAIVAAAPTRVPAGEALARAKGIEAALSAGWAPGLAVGPELAPTLAWALIARGRVGEARAAVTRVNTPETWFHRTAIADLEGDVRGVERAWPLAIPPPGAPIAPGVIWATREKSSNFVAHTVLAVLRPTSRIRATGAFTGCDGPPVVQVRFGSRPAVSLRLEGPWTEAAAVLPEGAYRLEVRWDNDLAQGGRCDRNISELSLALD